MGCKYSRFRVPYKREKCSPRVETAAGKRGKCQVTWPLCRSREKNTPCLISLLTRAQLRSFIWTVQLPMFFRSFCLLWILSILSLVGRRDGILYPLVPLRHLFATWELRCWNYFFSDVNGDDHEILRVRRFFRVWVENALLLMQKSK